MQAPGDLRAGRSDHSPNPARFDRWHWYRTAAVWEAASLTSSERTLLSLRLTAPLAPELGQHSPDPPLETGHRSAPMLPELGSPWQWQGYRRPPTFLDFWQATMPCHLPSMLKWTEARMKLCPRLPARRCPGWRGRADYLPGEPESHLPVLQQVHSRWGALQQRTAQQSLAPECQLPLEAVQRRPMAKAPLPVLAGSKPVMQMTRARLIAGSWRWSPTLPGPIPGVR